MGSKKFYTLIIIILAGVVIYWSGPKPHIDTTITPLSLPKDLDLYLERKESLYDDIVPGTEKKIFWAGKKGEKTDLAFVYIHGFSASRGETEPLSQRVANRFRANLFCTRLTGHGRSSAALLKGSVNAWLNDVVEAYEIGRRIGKKIIFIGVSTGASELAWLASQTEYSDIAGLVWISPNFGPRDKTANILLFPWGKQVAELMVGKTRSWNASNPLHEKYWTNSYPTGALVPMMGIVKLARKAPLEKIEMPILVIYSPHDRVVDPSLTIKYFLNISSDQKKLIAYPNATDPDQHVLAGYALSPESTNELAKIMADYIEKTIEISRLPVIRMETELGNIIIEADTVRAPITAKNFLRYIDERRFQGACFYRVVTPDNQPDNNIKIEVIQGGIPDEASLLRLPPIPHETTEQTGLFHKDGTVSMARLGPGTADAEFFICINDQPELDFGGKRNPDGQGFAAFGQVIEGMDVARSIQQGPAKGQMLLQPVKIFSINH
ncbi:MAG: alpha/beta fold hydrolase [Candidatus Marinimicrobia bacterium]|nr:alpha/beta fold hydrolase [Candidatus Neomarinimicrobiota bacterium]